MQESTPSTHHAAVEVDLGARVRAALVAAFLGTFILLAAFLGTFILLGTGFAQPQALHNAAHDARHANAFPCH